MEDAYSELKSVSDMKASINNVISNSRRLYRPPSLSESFAWTAENVLRANKSNTSLDLIMSPSPASTPVPSPPPPPSVTNKMCEETANYALHFLFHISLISIFESVFFFLYISKLEDNGINKTVDGFVNNLITSCSNFTSAEKNITNDILNLFVNSTLIINAGNSAESARSIYNKNLFMRAWIYVGSLAGIFTFLTIVVCAQTIHIKWKKLVLENIGLVTLLAAYEYTFFSTVIFPYNAISGPEILRNTVFELQDTCGLFDTK